MKTRLVPHAILAAVLLSALQPFSPSAFSSIAVISNNKVKITYDLDTGLMQCDYAAGSMSLKNITSAAKTESALLSSADARYIRSQTTRKTTDNLGPARELTIHCADTQNIADLEIQIRLYENNESNNSTGDSFTIKTTLANRFGKDLGVIELQPLRAAAVQLGGDPANYKVSAEGMHMVDPGAFAKLSDSPKIGSWLNVLLLDEQTNKTLHAGFITSDIAESYLMLKKTVASTSAPGAAAPTLNSELRTLNSGDEVALSTHCMLLMPGKTGARRRVSHLPWNDLRDGGWSTAYPVIVRPDSSMSSEVLMVSFGSDPFAALNNYASTFNKYNQQRTLLPAAQGWCGWPYYYWAMDENDMLANARFVAEHFRDHYGMQYIQIDGGWQIKAGEWEADPRHFPRGMKWIADEIHKLGLKPGIWISPFEIDETSDIAKKHPDWLIKKRDGTPQTFGKAHSKPPQFIDKRPDGKIPNMYALDITHPDAREWLRALFKKVVHDWGYDLVKIDWAYTTYSEAESFRDPTITKTQAYRMFMQTMREAVGEKCYILNCFAYTGVGIGDSNRIGIDSDATVGNLASPSGPPRAIGRRFYLNNQFWRNDPDMVIVRPPRTPEQNKALAPKRKAIDKRLALGGFTLGQARAAASVISMCGGQLFSGDNLPELPADRLDILKKILPAHPVAATPVDVFDNTYPSIYNWCLEKTFASWNVLGLYNWTDAPLTRRVDFKKLGLDPAKTYLCYDFWQNRFLGEKQNEISMPLDSIDCAIISIHEKKNIPQVISTSRHITQGQPDLIDIKWDPAKNTLSGVSKVVPDADYEVVVYVPGNFTFDNLQSTAAKHKASPEGKIIKLQLNPQKQDRVEWTLRFTKGGAH